MDPAAQSPTFDEESGGCVAASPQDSWRSPDLRARLILNGRQLGVPMVPKEGWANLPVRNKSAVTQRLPEYSYHSQEPQYVSTMPKAAGE